MRIFIIIFTFFILIPSYSEAADEMLETEIQSEKTAIIVAIISAIGVIGALIFNGLTHLKETKSQHYQAFKDLEEEFTKIQEEFPKIRKWDNDHALVIQKQSENDFVSVNMFRWKYVQFHEKVAHLAIQKIISKEIARYYHTTFPYALRYVDLVLDPEKVKSTCTFLYQWCEKEKILSKN